MSSNTGKNQKNHKQGGKHAGKDGGRQRKEGTKGKHGGGSDSKMGDKARVSALEKEVGMLKSLLGDRHVPGSAQAMQPIATGGQKTKKEGESRNSGGAPAATVNVDTTWTTISGQMASRPPVQGEKAVYRVPAGPQVAGLHDKSALRKFDVVLLSALHSVRYISWLARLEQAATQDKTQAQLFETYDNKITLYFQQDRQQDNCLARMAAYMRSAHPPPPGVLSLRLTSDWDTLTSIPQAPPTGSLFYQILIPLPVGSTSLADAGAVYLDIKGHGVDARLTLSIRDVLLLGIEFQVGVGKDVDGEKVQVLRRFLKL